jgi:hypothetical protein
VIPTVTAVSPCRVPTATEMPTATRVTLSERGAAAEHQSGYAAQRDIRPDGALIFHNFTSTAAE